MKVADDTLRHMIEAVAVKHGVALDCDDPLLMIHTIFECLMKSAADEQRLMRAECQEEMIRTVRQWETLATDHANETLKQILDSIKGGIVDTIRIEMEAARCQLEADHQRRQRGSSLTLLASVLTLIASAIVLWATTN